LTKLNVDENSDKPMEYQITSLPSILAFHQGKLIRQFIGLQSESFIDQFFQDLSTTVTKKD